MDHKDNPRVKILTGVILILASFTYIFIVFLGTSLVGVTFTNKLKTNDTRYMPLDRNVTELWKSVRSLIHGDFLYPKDFDVSRVINALRHGRIVHADVFAETTSLKWMLVLEGDQKAIFKVKTQAKLRSYQECNVGCEHPEYEVVGFTLNRMFDLRNMPFVSGRVLSWSDDLKPVATAELKEFVEVENDGSVCFNWTCWQHHRDSRFCYDKGQIPGAMIYFLENDGHVIPSRKNHYHSYHPYGIDDERNLDRLPGDKTFCNRFRRKYPYQDDNWFLDIIDISIVDFVMSHDDSRHAYIGDIGRNSSGPLLNIIYDYGAAFCDFPYIRILAPLLQCCRIRTRLYKTLLIHQNSFQESFTAYTQDDPLFPLLLPELLSEMTMRFKQVLKYVDFCLNLDGNSNVLVTV